uniref:Kinesin motor domain-containing protein n=1 Tax=Parascaris univalens TaxID=6257 RepID=A0A915BEH9_PARUN
MVCRHGIECSEIECIYSCSHWSSLLPPHLVIKKFISAMERCHNENKISVKCTADIAYGESDRQRIDIWGDEENSRMGIAFFHGGYWQEGDRKYFTSMVKPLTESGIAVACVGYDLALSLPLTALIDEAIKALQFLRERWKMKQLSVGGHSAAVLSLSHECRFDCVFLLSGIFQLSDLPGTYIGKAINLTLEEARKVSIREVAQFKGRVRLMVGSLESPEIIAQSERIHELFRSRNNKDVELKLIDGEDHFSLIENLSDRNSLQMIEILNTINQKGC